MGYRVKTGRPLTKVEPDRLSAVQGAIRKRKDGLAIAMSFDPGTAGDGMLHTHALDMLMGLLHVRGWTLEQQQVLLGNAGDWSDRWWQGTLGPDAFIVETPLWPDPRCEVDDVGRIMNLAAAAWCMELETCQRERPTPDLMTVMTPEGLCLASIHEEPWKEGFRERHDLVRKRMKTQPDGTGSRSHAYVEMHLEGTSVRPWSLPERSCVFGTLVTDPDWTRVYVVLRDTAREPDPETARALLRLMLACGTDD